MASEVGEVLQGLSSKFEQLVSLYEKARVENDTLRTGKVKVEKKAHELEEKNKSLLITQAFTASSGSADEAKEKISKIVREIDKCITLLSR